MAGVAEAAVATQHNAASKNDLMGMRRSLGRWFCFAGERLRIEHGYSEVVVLQEFLRNLAHLPGVNRLQLLQHQREGLMAEADTFHRSDLHRLIKQRVELV